MQFSKFGKKITTLSGILELMDDLGRSWTAKGKRIMLGGGIPANIPAMQKIYRKRMFEILKNGTQFEDLISNYDTPQGNIGFIQEFAAFLRKQFGWKVSEKNIAS